MRPRPKIEVPYSKQQLQHFAKPELAENVYALAETMAHSDLVFHEREQDVLRALASALGLTQAPTTALA